MIVTGETAWNSDTAVRTSDARGASGTYSHPPVKEGFLRSETSLIQTIGRAARNAGGRVIMYADNMTDSMKKAIGETERRRKIQQQYNEEHGITPQTIRKAVRELISISRKITKEQLRFEKDPESMDQGELEKLIAEVEKKMRRAAAELDFETAAMLRDRMLELKKEDF